MFNENTLPLDSSMEDLVRELKVILYELADTLQHIEAAQTDIDFSRFIFAANACRESLPRTAVYSGRGPAESEENQIIAGIQKYILDNKISLEDAFAFFDIDESGHLEFQEFRLTVRKLLGNISSALIESAFNEMDEDHSGTVQFIEFSSKIRKYFTKTPRNAKLNNAKDDNDFIKNETPNTPKNNKELSISKLLENFANNIENMNKNCDLNLLGKIIKEKYIDPALNSRENTLSDSITKLGLVFYKKKDHIYLIKLLKLLIPKFVSKERIFDEMDNEEHKRKKEFMEFQVTLSDAGLLKLALSMIDPTNKDNLIKQAAQLVISLLRFGNQSIQNRFLNLLKNQTNSELFSYIRSQLREFRDLLVEDSFDAFIKDPDAIVDNVLLSDSSNYKANKENKSNKKPYLIKFLIELLQLCCENCFLPFQNFLRTQERGETIAKDISINIIDEVSSFLINIKQIGGNLLLDPEAAQVVIQCFECLIDMCRGPCTENQLLLGTKKKLYKFVNSILKLYNHNKEFKHIFKSAVRYLSALLEGNFPKEVASAMIDFIDFELLANLALEIYNDFIIPKKSAIFLEAIIGTNTDNELLKIIKTMCGYFKINLIEIEAEE